MIDQIVAFIAVTILVLILLFPIQTVVREAFMPVPDPTPVRTPPPPKESSIDQSIRMEGHQQISAAATRGMDMKVLMDIESADDCHKLCDIEDEFDCRVHDYQEATKMCTLSTKSDLRFNKTDSDSSYTTYTSDIVEESEFNEFSKIPQRVPRIGGVVRSSNDNVMNLGSCQISCLKDHHCNAFTWNVDSQSCTHYDQEVGMDDTSPSLSTHLYVRR